MHASEGIFIAGKADNCKNIPYALYAVPSGTDKTAYDLEQISLPGGKKILHSLGRNCAYTEIIPELGYR